MAFSIDLVIVSIDQIFGDNLHEIIVPESARPYVSFSYDEEIDLNQKRKLCALFPEDWYVYFHPGTIHKDPGVDI